MRVVVAYGPDVDIRPLRQALLAAGFDCRMEDCVAWAELDVRLAGGGVDVVVLQTADVDSREWASLAFSLASASAPAIMTGPVMDSQRVRQAHDIGVVEYLVMTDLDRVVDAARRYGCPPDTPRKGSGRIVAVLATLPGSGATTVAANLAAALADPAGEDESVALIEFEPQADLALLLNLKPDHFVQDLCPRWEMLDGIGLRNCVTRHSSGICLLPYSGDPITSQTVPADLVRRLLVLSRAGFRNTVVALGGQLDAAALEAMRLSDDMLLVTRADVPAVRRGRRVLEVCVERGVDRRRCRVVVNRWGQPGQLKADQIETGMAAPVFAFLPEDVARVNEGVNQGLLLGELSPGARLATGFQNLAAMLGGKPPERGSWPWSEWLGGRRGRAAPQTRELQGVR